MPGQDNSNAPFREMLGGWPDFPSAFERKEPESETPSTLEQILGELKQINQFLRSRVLARELAEVQAAYKALKEKANG